MISFSNKKIENPLTLGESLRQVRQEKNLSLKQVSKAISISGKYLEALEKGNYQELPGEVYARNFLKAYTKFLGLDSEKFVNLFSSENIIYKKTKYSGVKDFTKPVEKISKAHLVVTPRIVRSLVLGLLAIVVLSYLGIKVKNILTPPILIVEAPADNIVTTDTFLEVGGYAEKDVIIEINGEQVLADNDGNFNETIDLQLGTNAIEVKAMKRHGKETKVYRQIVVVSPDENLNNQQEISN